MKSTQLVIGVNLQATRRSASRGALACLLVSLWSPSIAQAEEFVAPHNTEQAASRPLSPDEVCATVKLPPGFRLSAFASEPDVQNPIAITTDDRGRLWVAENYTWAGARDGNFDVSLKDRIVILEDSDGDGRMDKRTVFWDQGARLTSIEVGFGGVWALCSPHMLFIPDQNRDDVPDGPPVIVLDGFDTEAVSHTAANGLKWGPDGWLYGRHGILGTSKIGKPGAHESERVAINTGVWRYHPVKGDCEAVMHGMTNPWGFDFNEVGEMFVTNTVIGHLWHVIPGARTERMFGLDFNPHAYQLVKQVADHVHWDTGESWDDVRAGVTDGTSAAGGGHAHTGLMIYQGDSWPAEYRGQAFTLNLHGRRVNCDRLERTPVGYVARHGSDMGFVADPWFRGMDLISGPDGGAFIADWSDTGECHEMDGVHRTSGRIYKLDYGSPRKTPLFDLAALSDVELANKQREQNDWHARHARRLLQERASSSALSADDARERLLTLFRDSGEQVTRLRAFWTLYFIGGAEESWLLQQLQHPDEHVRVWAIRFLADAQTSGDDGPSDQLLAAFTTAAETDASGLVLLHLASSLQRFPVHERWHIGSALASRRESNFTADRTLAIMLWLAMEPLVAEDGERALTLIRQTQFPLIRENIARRLALKIDDDLPAVERLLAATEEEGLAAPIFSGLIQALVGRQNCPAPGNWNDVATRVGRSLNDATRQDFLALGVVFRDPNVLEELSRTVESQQALPEDRRRALQLLLVARPPDLGPSLIRLMKDETLAAEAIQGLALYEIPENAEDLLASYHALTPELRVVAIDALASRPTFARALVSALAEKQLSPRDVTAFHVRQMIEFGDEDLTERLRELWGDVRATSEEKKKLIEEYKARWAESGLADADLADGKELYARTCAACHTLRGEGGKVGPDLTGSDRKNVAYLLENIVDPSAAVGADFRATIFLLTDGRVLSGVLREQNERTITIETQQGRHTLDRQEIEEASPSDASLMPEGLLQGLTESQILNLLAFMASD